MAGHYFNEDPDVTSDVRRLRLHLPDISLDLDADRGVFAADHVDAGTRVLLTEAVRPKAGSTVLDLGCGYGPIACVAASREPAAAVWATDVNDRARSLCQGNGERLELDVVVRAPAEIPAELAFDLIASNPPIRIGKANLHRLLTRWLDRLTPSGHAELVVHKHLGSDSLAKWLNGQGWQTERIVSRGGYRVLRVRPRSQPAL